MKLFEKLSHRPNGHDFHSAFVTTFSVEFAAFEQVLLPQFEASGATNVLLLGDQRMTALAMADGSSPPKHAGNAYVVSGPRQPVGVFHPKIFLQIGRRGARAIIASANATSAGIGGNLEIAAEVTCTEEPSPEQQFIASVVGYLQRVVGPEPSAAREALTWMDSRTHWLPNSATEKQATLPLADGSAIGFWANRDGATRSLLARFADQVGAEPIERLIVVSPYWDHDLAALKAMIAAFSPASVFIVLQAESALFPVDAAASLPLQIVPVPDKVGSRFVHAKMIIATVAGVDHVLAGSANCTSAALGTFDAEGGNDEACVYRKMPAGELVEALGLAASLAGPAIDPTDIPPFQPTPPIPLGEMQSRSPGVFDAEFGRLVWKPPLTVDVGQIDVELLDASLEPFDMLEPAGWRQTDDGYVADFEGSADIARFAQLRRGDWSSIPAIIHRRDTLRERRRERSNRTVERANSALDGSLDIDLIHLELLSQLERADADDAAHVLRRQRTNRADGDTEAPPEVLSYEEFTRLKRDAENHSVFSRNALAHRHASSIRGMLNRIVGIDAGELTKPPEEPDFDPFDMGDEGGTDENGEPTATDDPPPSVTAVLEPEPEPEQRAPFDQRAFEKAVNQYVTAVTEKAATDHLGAVDVLRLRLLVLVLLSHADQPDTSRKKQKGLNCGTAVADWPRLLTRVLAAFFHGKLAPISRLGIDPAFDRLPDDFMEAWATAVWSIDICLAAVAKVQPNAPLLKHLHLLKAEIHQRTGLSAAELSGEVFTSNLRRLEQRYGSLAHSYDEP